MTFAAHLPNRPMYGIQARAYAEVKPAPATAEEMIADYLDQVLAIQPEGPYRLLGYSFGGTIAHAMAAELQRLGHRVELLALLDCAPSKYFKRLKNMDAAKVRELLSETVSEFTGAGDFDFLLDKSAAVLMQNTALLGRLPVPVFDGDALFFSAALNKGRSYARLWRRYVRGAITSHEIEVTHADMCTSESAAAISAVLDRVLDRGETPAPPDPKSPNVLARMRKSLTRARKRP
jgi:thioesterase domain-containing protein